MDTPQKDGQTQITLTANQYLTLLKAVYLGAWMANSHRAGTDDDPRYAEFVEISDFLFSLAPKFGLAHFVDSVSAGDSAHLPTMEFEEETGVHALHHEYDDDTFWDELCDRLGERDFHRRYTPEEIMEMSEDERFMKLQECVIAYEVETEKHGIDKLEAMKTLEDLGF